MGHMKPNCVYIAGPMRGMPERNYPAFHEAEARLVELGHEVINPARIEDEWTGVDWAGCLRRDIALIVTRCSMVAALPGWQRSKGASLEVHVARELGMRVFCAVSMEEIVFEELV